jgi:citronellol/citronellal dehydrogenase
VTVTDVLQLLRPGLLEGRSVALAGPARGVFGEVLASLGAQVGGLEADLADEAAAEERARALGPVDALVVDAAARFAHATTGDELGPLRHAIDGAWTATRATANAAWIGPQRPGKVVFLAPEPGAGPHAEAARAALENMARTLSIEWARYRITTVAITPAPATTEQTQAALTAYLVSAAGDYFSGTRLELS